MKGYLEDGLDEALQGCDVVVVPAGVPRKPGQPQGSTSAHTMCCVNNTLMCDYYHITICVCVYVGMTRDDLFNTNASIVQKLAEAAAK